MNRSLATRILVAMVWMVMMMFGNTNTMFAQTTKVCDCYCAVPGQGATKYPSDNAKITNTDCQTMCRDAGYSVAACAYAPDQKPQYNTSCYTPTECAEQGGVMTASGTGTPKQPGECPAGMFYCYPNPATTEKTQLQVSIGGLIETGDLGEYLNTAYKWLVGAGTTFAIVFMMVAGLRWSLGGLNAEQMKAAKTHIANALIGLVLLMGSYVILYTVNPHLVRLQVPALPLVKTVSLVGEESCGYLNGVWGGGPYLIKNGAPLDSPYAAGQPAPDGGNPYKLANPTKGTLCGSVADVVEDGSGNRIADDQTCRFDYCQDRNDRCFVTATEGYCLSCGDFAYGQSPPLPASQSICSKLSNPANGKTCLYVSSDSYASNVGDLVGSFLGLSVSTELLESPVCVSCENKQCSSLKTRTLCELDPCALNCAWVPLGGASLVGIVAIALDEGVCRAQ